jgi:hypothetical protein
MERIGYLWKIGEQKLWKTDINGIAIEVMCLIIREVVVSADART